MAEENLRILAVDSSSLTGSVALCQGESLVAESLLNVRSTHSEKLLAQIDLLLNEAGWTLADLDLLAAVTGPGSFTGLRIGIATVMGLAEAAGKQMAGVSSLQMLAMNLPLCPVPICVFMDARKKEVYSQTFDWSPEGPIPVNEARVVQPAVLLEELQQTGNSVALVGDGVSLYCDLIKELLPEQALLPSATAHQPRAAHAAWLAGQAHSAGKNSIGTKLLPIYVRPSDAELGMKKS